VYKRQIYQIAETNRKNRFGSDNRIESNRNFFCPNWNALHCGRGLSFCSTRRRRVAMCARCRRSLEAEDVALASRPTDVISKCPHTPVDYVRARYLACEHGALRPLSLVASHAARTAALDVVTSHVAPRDLDDDDDDDRRHLSTSRCHCARQLGHRTQFGTFSPSQPAVAPPT